MGFFDDLGKAGLNLATGVGDSVAGKSQAEIAKMQLQNQRDALLTLERLNSGGKSNTGLIIGIVIAAVVIVGIIVYVAFIKPKK